MRTDDDLITLLRRGFTQATADLDPEPDLVRVVRRRYVRGRRRRLVVGVAVPAVAVAVGAGLTLPGRDIPNQTANHTPNRTPSQSAAAVPRTPPLTRVPVKHARYKLVAFHQGSVPPSCPANATAPFGKSATPEPGVWFFTKQGACVFVGVGGADTKPASATPVDIAGHPGVYGTLNGEVRTIYAPSASGGWWVLKMSANAPKEIAVRVIVPAN